MIRIRIVFILALVASGSARAQDLSSFEKILFPVLSRAPVHGIGGSTFTTRLFVITRQETRFYPAQGKTFGRISSVLPYQQSIEYEDPAGISRGRLLFFERATVEKVSFGYDLTSTGVNVPDDVTQLPVVRERDFLTGPAFIVNMPVTPNVAFDPVPHSDGTYKERNTIRIYDVDNTGQLTVEINFRPLPIGAIFAGPTLKVDRRDGDDPSYPLYGEMTFDGPCITLPTGINCRAYSHTVEIQPTDPTIRYWAFISTTDNTTQYVTIRKPQ